MKKFIVTGLMRSGTTYMATILNSQKSTFCIEDNPFEMISEARKINSVEDFNVFYNIILSQFIYLGLDSPKNLYSAKNVEDILNLYFLHLCKVYKSENIGFKITMLKQDKILNFINEGYKIILMKRDLSKVLKSWVNRIDSDLGKASFEIQEYLKGINYYKLEFSPKDFIIIDYEELLINKKKILNNLSDFLEIEINSTEILYHSFNKNRFQFENNSSFNKMNGVLVNTLNKKYNEADYEDALNKIKTGKYRNYKKTIKDLIKNLKKFI